MAIVQISKIIQKQGNLADLPQLDAAEIGYATDSKRLYIGDELPSEPDPTLLYNTEILTENSVDGTSIIYDPVTGVISSVGGGGGGGTVTSVGVSGGVTGLTTTGGPITTFGTITIGGVLGVAHGGTGSNTANGALYNILPSVANNVGKYLYTDGANISWANVSSGTSLPDQTNNAGKFLTTDGANASWDLVFPEQTGNAGKYLMTDGLNVMWGPVGNCDFDEYYQNVSLLLLCSEAVGANNLMDSSWWGEDKSLPGQWEFSADRSKFGETSLFVKEGVGPTWEDYRFTRHADSGYTIEMWFRPENRDSLSIQAPNLFKLYDVASGDPIIQVSLYQDDTALTIDFESDPGTLYYYSSGPQGWNHMAVVFQLNNDIDFYVNGDRLATRLASEGIIAGSLSEEWGFQLVSSDQSGNSYTCYVDGVRVTNGVSRYSGATYTVPDTQFGNVPENGDPYWDDVTLLAHFDGANFSTDFIDSSQYSNSILANGGANLSTTQQAFGPSSLYVSSGSATCFNQPGFSADFTIECWVYYEESAWLVDNSYPIWSTQAGVTFPAKNFGIQVYTTGAGITVLQLNTYDPNSSPPSYNWTNIRSDTNINLFNPQTWHAVVVQRRSGRLQGFVDGIMVIDVANTDQFEASGDIQLIGRFGMSNQTGQQEWDGYIDEFRITREIARYTDLVAPMGPFPLEVCTITEGLVTYIDVSGGNTGLTTIGGPVIDSGTITLTGTLNIQSGGTGANTATDAINALLPSQTSQSGNFLTTNGTTVSWAAAGGSGGVTQIIAGTNVTIDPTGGTGAVTINSSGVLGSPVTTGIFVPNNTFETITHNLGRIPVIILWTLEADLGSVDQPAYDKEQRPMFG